jgi:hypothetical protein
MRARGSFRPIGSLRAPTDETAGRPLGSRASPVTTILLSRGTSSFPILHKVKMKRNSKRRANAITSTKQHTAGRSPSKRSPTLIKHLSFLCTAADSKLRLESKRVVDSAEPIPGVSEKSKAKFKNQNQPIRRARLPGAAPSDPFRLRLSFRSKAATASGALAR